MAELLKKIWNLLTKELAQSSPLDLLIKLLAAIVLLGALWLLKWLIEELWSWLRTTIPPWWDCCRKLARLRAAIDEDGPGLWLTIKRGSEADSISEKLRDLGKLILTIANLKGGVGKTTLTANLAAYFANPFNDSGRQQRRVLVIDLDFQASQSFMLFTGVGWQPDEHQLSEASLLIKGLIQPNHQGQIGQLVDGVAGARGISAFYDLLRTEESEKNRWLIGDTNEDIRYRLARLLLSDNILNSFDVVLIDAPPRLTTASIQALCASTHVLIPTILDPVSGLTPVYHFGEQLKGHDQLFPQLKVMGVVGTLANRQSRGAEIPVLNNAGDRLRDALNGAAGQLNYIETRETRFEFPYECSLFRSAPLAHAAGSGVAYASMGDTADGRAVRAMIDNIGQEVVRRWPL